MRTTGLTFARPMRCAYSPTGTTRIHGPRASSACRTAPTVR
jgi:hypothetical protein